MQKINVLSHFYTNTEVFVFFEVVRSGESTAP